MIIYEVYQGYFEGEYPKLHKFSKSYTNVSYIIETGLPHTQGIQGN